MKGGFKIGRRDMTYGDDASMEGEGADSDEDCDEPNIGMNKTLRTSSSEDEELRR